MSRTRLSIYTCFAGTTTHYHTELEKVASQFYDEMDTRGYVVPKTASDYSRNPSSGSGKIRPVDGISTRDLVLRERERKKGRRGLVCSNDKSIEIEVSGGRDKPAGAALKKPIDGRNDGGADKEAYCVWPPAAAAVAERSVSKKKKKHHYARRWSLKGLIMSF